MTGGMRALGRSIANCICLVGMTVAVIAIVIAVVTAKVAPGC